MLDRVLVDRDSAAVVVDRDPAVCAQGDVDAVGVAREGLVDGVVDNLVDEMVQTALAGRPDVHARPLADGIEPFENGDRGSVVGGVKGLGGHVVGCPPHAVLGSGLQTCA